MSGARDLPADLTAHRDALAEAIQMNAPKVDTVNALADAILAAGVLRDAAHVETEARAKAGEDIARALDQEAAEFRRLASDWGRASDSFRLYHRRASEAERFARIARDTTAGTT